MPEEKFSKLEYSDDEIAALRDQMATVVDCRELAERMTGDRRPANPFRRRLLMHRFGIDADRTLTEIEGVDLGDTTLWADLADVHALRHVPLGHWSDGDIALMLVYGHGGPTVQGLALERLERQPLLEAAHYEGDLLVVTARRISAESSNADAVGQWMRKVMAEVLGATEQEIWTRFYAHCAELGLGGPDVGAARQRLSSGARPPAGNPFGDTGHALNMLAEATDLIAPARRLWVAEAELPYARYRKRMGVELMPRTEFSDPEIRAGLDAPDGFWFSRQTRFQIVEDGLGVRLRHFADSAVENWHGMAFETAEAARAHATWTYGVPQEAWEKQ